MLKIEEAVKKWFTGIIDCLTAYGSPRTPMDRVIMPSVSVIEAYLMSACLLARLKRILPARALLRPVGEFTAKIKYCATKDTIERIQRWQKSSWKRYREYWEATRSACQAHDCTHMDARVVLADKELAQMANLKELPPMTGTKGILEEVYPQDLALRVGIYTEHLAATHIDLLTLDQTVAFETGGLKCTGDLVEEVEREGIGIDVLTEAYLFAETVLQYYASDCSGVLSEYNLLVQSNGGKRTN